MHLLAREDEKNCRAKCAIFEIHDQIVQAIFSRVGFACLLVVRVAAGGQSLIFHSVKVFCPRFVTLARPATAVVHVLCKCTGLALFVPKLLEECRLEQKVLQRHDTGRVGDEMHRALFDPPYPCGDTLGGIDRC